MSGAGAGGHYDPQRYYDEVVRGLRGRPRNLPADLRVRYALPVGLAGPDLRAHVERVVADWTARVEDTREGEVYRALLTAHTETAADPHVELFSPDWWSRYRPSPDAPSPQAEPPPVVPRAAPAPATVHDPPSAAPRPVDPAPRAPAAQPVLDVDEPHGLTVRRFGDVAELGWVWPGWGVEAVVEWSTGFPAAERHQARITRHEYEQRGCWRTEVGEEPASFTVSVGGVDRTAPALTAELAAGSPRVHYSISRLWWQGARDYRVTFTATRPPVQWCEIAIGFSRSASLPDRDDLTPLASTPVISGVTSRTVTLPRRSGARWLRCVLVEGDEVDLIDPDRELLRVRPWPR